MSDEIDFPSGEPMENEVESSAVEQAALDASTLDSEAQVELAGDFIESEAIEAALVDLVSEIPEIVVFPEIESVDAEAKDDQSQDYVGVMLKQGEVLQDQDWNEGEGSTEVVMDGVDGESKDDTQSDEIAATEAVDGEANDDQHGDEMVDFKPIPAEQLSDGVLDQSTVTVEGHPSQLPISRVSKIDEFTAKLDTAEDEVGDLRIPSKHSPKNEPLPSRDPIGATREAVESPTSRTSSREEPEEMYVEVNAEVNHEVPMASQEHKSEAEIEPETREEGTTGSGSDGIDRGKETESGADSSEQYVPPGESGLSSIGGFELESDEDTAQGTTEGDGESDADEGWKPPEMYVYHAPDGSVIFVDANGNPIDLPPILKGAPDPDAGGGYSAWYPGSDPSETFEVKEYIPTLRGVFAYVEQDGSVSLVDKDGKPVTSPPSTFKDGESGKIYASGSDGSKLEIPIYNSPIEDIYAYTAQDGSISLVDKNGNLVYSPPWFMRDPELGEIFTKDQQGGMVEIPPFMPSTEGIFAYTAQDGSVTLVDEQGVAVPCPPWFMRDAIDSDVFAKDIEGAKVKIPPYTPPTAGIYAYTAQDGSITLVDENGKMVQCPPWYMKDPEVGEVFAKDTAGAKIEIPAFASKLDDIFVYATADGSMMVVDKDGNLVDSPPHLTKIVDGSGKVHIYASNPGSSEGGAPVELNYYKPIWTKEKK